MMIGPLIRLVFAMLLPLAAFTVLKLWGLRLGGWWVCGIACGIFIYHYLQWALFETERVVAGAGLRRRDWSWAWWLGSIFLVGALVGADWDRWIVEQFLLEVVAFSAGIALLAVFKAAREGKEAPWWLVILVFVCPPAAMIWKILPYWIGRHHGAPFPTWVLFGGAFLAGLLGVFFRLKPYAMGQSMLVEPLSQGGRVVLAVAWFILLIVGACLFAAL